MPAKTMPAPKTEAQIAVEQAERITRLARSTVNDAFALNSVHNAMRRGHVSTPDELDLDALVKTHMRWVGACYRAELERGIELYRAKRKS